MDGSQTLDPIEAKPENIALRAVRRLLVIPRAIVYLCDAWIFAFMWLNNMEYAALLFKRLFPDGTPQAHSEPKKCDYCSSSDIDTRVIRCPANHLVCADCLPEHAEVKVICLSPGGCGLEFTLEELESLPQEDLLDAKGVYVTQSDGESTDEEELGLPGVVEPEDDDEGPYAAEHDHDGEGGDQIGAGVKLEEPIPARQNDTTIVKTEVKAEETVDEVPAEPLPESEPEPVSRIKEEEEFAASSISHRVKSRVRFAQHSDATEPTTRAASNWLSNLPAGSITAPPAPRSRCNREVNNDPGPSTRPSDDMYQDPEYDEPPQAPATAPPFPARTKQKKEPGVARRPPKSKQAIPAPGTNLHLDKLREDLKEATRLRKNAHARQATAVTNVEKGKWPQQELDERNEALDAAEADLKAAQTALDEYLDTLSP